MRTRWLHEVIALTCNFRDRLRDRDGDGDRDRDRDRDREQVRGGVRPRFGAGVGFSVLTHRHTKLLTLM